MYLGIDPGINGALVVLDQHLAIVSTLLMPSIEIHKENRVCGKTIRDWLCTQPPIQHAFIEHVGSIRKGGQAQGSVTMFTFGHAAGKVEGVVEAFGIPFTKIRPSLWKGYARIMGHDKDASRHKCFNLYPANQELFKYKGEGQAIADAILIAHYGKFILDKDASKG